MSTVEIEEYSLWLKGIDIGLDAIVAIVILFVGWLIKQHLKRLDSRQTIAAALFERRSILFSEISSDLNRIFCSCAYVGNWLNDNPNEILEAKRRCDSKLFGEIAFWDSDVIEHYKQFSEVCFSTYQGRGRCATLRADANKYVEVLGDSWANQQQDFFVKEVERRAWLDEQAKLLGKARVSFSQDLVVPSYSRLIASIGNCLGGQIDETKIAATLKRPVSG